MIHHKEPQPRIFCSYSKPEIKPDLNFVLVVRKIHIDFVSFYIGWPNLPNENTVNSIIFRIPFVSQNGTKQQRLFVAIFGGSEVLGVP